jgi:CRP-like cAMP-binding protein
MILLDTLKKCEIFLGLKDYELEIIGETAKIVTYTAGSRIFEENSIATNLYFIQKGKIEITMRNEQSRSMLPIDTLGACEIFGWSAVTEPHSFTAAAHALQDTELIAFKGDVLRDIFKKNNHIGYLVMSHVASVISSRFRKLNQQLVNIT